jgi:ribose/xylose/arabinose/galactoside ABC-type transport system permease subunit/ABC-type sugar transport system substrate-binding protein
MKADRRGFFRFLALAAMAPPMAQSMPRRTIALLFDSLISPFWIAALERFRLQARARGWQVLEAVSNMDDGRQFTQVESMIERGVDGIVIVHTDDKAVIPAIRAANAAEIPMVHFNRSPSPSDAYSVAVVADNRRLMDQTVTALIELGGRPARPHRAAILLGDLGDANGARRRDGFDDAVGRHADVIEVVARIATEWNADKAFAGLRDALQVHPDIDFLVTSSDFMTPQIEQALRVAGKWHPSGTPGHVLVAGFDGDENGYAQLAAGYFDVDGVQSLDYEVELTLGALEQLWAGKRPPKVLVDPGFVVTRETLSTRRDQMWGYRLWKAKVAVTLSEPTATPGPAGTASLPGPAGATAAGAQGSPGGMGWLVALAGFTAFAKTLLSITTLYDVLLAMLPLAILVAGQMLVLLIGQIDLSMTAVMAVSSIVSAAVMTRYASGVGDPGATLLGVLSFIAIGTAMGLFNGICHAIWRVPSFIATLAVMMAGSGAAVWYASTVSDTISIGGLPRAFRFIGYGSTFGMPVALVLSGGILAIAHLVLSRTLAGRWMYALGHNREAARISGVPVRGVAIGVFAASGFCAGLASLIYTSRIETGLPTLGDNMLLDIVGAAVIGGVSLFGGRANVWMVLAGAAFLSALDKSLQLLGMSLFVVLAVKGCAILVAAMWDASWVRRARRA